MINDKRLTKTFLDLCAIESPSGKEKAASAFVKKRLAEIGLGFKEDSYGNLTATIPGVGKPLLLCAHLDTVNPCRNPKSTLKNGVFRSQSKTSVLGADNKAPLAAVLEFLQTRKKLSLKTRPLEIIFTVEEELGSKGASQLNFETLKATRALIFDREGPFGIITSAAPHYYQMDIEIIGKSAHAGLSPEKGINAILAAAVAMTKIRQGRIDEETTVNIGTISGGEARNTVPEKASLEAEVRSLNDQKAKALVGGVEKIFSDEAKRIGAKVIIKITKAANGFKLKESPFVKETKKALCALGLKPKFTPTCGGSDANIFNSEGIETLNLTYGTENNHTLQETISLTNLENIVELLLIQTKEKAPGSKSSNQGANKL